jgi:hypothetical protein
MQLEGSDYRCTHRMAHCPNPEQFIVIYQTYLEMGNAIDKKYDAPKEHTATAGHLQLWKIWPGKSKDIFGRQVSIWAFDKTELLNKKKDSGGTASSIDNLTLDKTSVEQLYQIMRKDMTVAKESGACPSLISTNEVSYLNSWQLSNNIVSSLLWLFLLLWLCFVCVARLLKTARVVWCLQLNESFVHWQTY